MARKGLPRQYAKMGFKRGWAAYKKTKRNPVRSRPIVRGRTMARRRGRRFTRARKTYSKARGFGGGGIVGNVLDGVIVGAVQGMVPAGALWGFGDALVPIGVGWFRKNNVLQTIGGYQLGLKIAQGMAGQGLGTAGFRGQE